MSPHLTDAISHPVRIGILALFTRKPDRSLAGADLLADLVAEDPDAFGHYKVGQILYHRSCLQRAKLLPT